ncbi:hypothetical protein [Olivibacter sp. XZL3]|uniref:hypothetical protein n=1 Tax=Olivibacter sp. XZL3 TaxID=1735116 RepID=UPI001066FA50|nr:hypothetical protein [Olivibacter sp. XZL3]
MKIKSALFPSLIGTTAMTMLSYSVSESKDENFKEPKLLAELVEKIFADEYKSLAKPSGWVMHYTMGFLMTAVFQEFWKQTDTIPNAKKGAYAGIVSGVAGILIWKTLFKVSKKNPKIPFKRYYGHLLLAHIVFSTGVALASRFVTPFQDDKQKSTS